MLFPYKDDNPRILIPYVTYGIIAINILVFVIQFNLGISNQMAEENFIYSFGFIPANFSFITIFTSMFLHGGFSHIMGNMWFLWVFGDNVEGVLGHAKYALFYILCFVENRFLTKGPGEIAIFTGPSRATFGKKL